MSHTRVARCAVPRLTAVAHCQARTSYGLASQRLPHGTDGALAVLQAIRLGSAFEAGQRRPHYARADLAAIAAGDADVHDRKYTAFQHLEDIDAGGRPAIAKRGNEVVGILAH